jgi:hypothetical protein
VIGTPEAGVRDGELASGAPDGEFVIGAPARGGGEFVIGALGARDGGEFVIGALGARDGGEFVIGALGARDGGEFVIGALGARDGGEFVPGVTLNRVVGGSSAPVAGGGGRADAGIAIRSAVSLPRRATSTANRRPHAITSTPVCGSLRSRSVASGVPCRNDKICARVTGCGLTARYSEPTRIAI